MMAVFKMNVDMYTETECVRNGNRGRVGERFHADGPMVRGKGKSSDGSAGVAQVKWDGRQTKPLLPLT